MSEAMFAAATAALQQAVALSREERDGALATAAQEVRARETAVRVQGELEAMVAQATAQREACAAEASAAADRGARVGAAGGGAAARAGAACEASLVAVGAERDAWASRAAELEASLQYVEAARARPLRRARQPPAPGVRGGAGRRRGAERARRRGAPGTAARPLVVRGRDRGRARLRALAAAVAGDALVAGLGAVAAERARRRAAPWTTPRARAAAEAALETLRRDCVAEASRQLAADAARSEARGDADAARARADAARAEDAALSARACRRRARFARWRARAAAAEARVAEASDAALGAFTAASADDRRRVVEAWAEDRAATTTRFLERLEALDRELALERAAAEVAAFALSDALEDLAPVAAILEIEGEDRGSRSASLRARRRLRDALPPLPDAPRGAGDAARAGQAVLRGPAVAAEAVARGAATGAAAPLRGGDLAGVCDDVEARAEEDDGGDGAVKVWVRVRPVKAGDDARTSSTRTGARARRATATAATATTPPAPYLAARGERRVDAAYLEIYQDQLRDLLGDDDDAAALKLREHPKRGVYVEGLTRWALESPRELLDLLEVGAARRTVAATRMNRDSSRSHAALFLTFDDGRGARRRS
ncbi:hypothetical protein SO694_00006457 [Aureococcus anophagefferens]|uniref:Kinesin motor domain-containing protein n=1 Tax=Aureococcus anophagefferens TaxID=44056 RepID=A0ABR1GAU2_AURAN